MDNSSRINSTGPEYLGPYRLEKKLGAGGMGEVFQAYDEELDRFVAIKRIRAGTTESAVTQERFRREARAIAGLSHPALVQVYHVERWQDQNCIVMEYVAGRTLSSVLRDGPLALDHAVALLQEIATGLAAAHERGIVHRDLKAGNVMVTAAGHVKILDFGLAKKLAATEASLSATGNVLGTFHAMSPEQAQSLEVDQRSDLFSFGVLAYEMLTGRSPFQAETVQETLVRIISYRQPAVREVAPEVPRELSDLVDRLLEKSPSSRPSGAAEVAKCLAGLSPVPSPARGTTVADLPTVDSHAPAAGLRGTRFPRRHRFLAAALLAAPALFLAWVIATYTAGQRPVVAVLGFENATGVEADTWLATALGEVVMAEFRLSPNSRWLGNDYMAELRQDLGISPGLEARREDLGILREDFGAAVVVTGAVLGKSGDGAQDELRVRLKLWDTTTGEVHEAGIFSGVRTNPFALARNVAEQCRKKLELSAPEDVTPLFPEDLAAARAYFRGLDLSEKHDLSEARDAFREALVNAGEHPIVQLRLAEILETLGEPFQEHARQALEYSTALPESFRLEVQGRASALLDDPESEIEAFQTLVEKHPEQPEYQFYLAVIDDTGTDLGALRESGLPGRLEAEAALCQAWQHERNQDEEQAEAFAREAVDLAEGLQASRILADARYAQGSYLERLGRRAQALEVLEEARHGFEVLSRREDVNKTLQLIAVVHAQLGHPDIARGILESFLGSEAEDPWAATFVQSLAVVLQDEGHFSEAQALLEAAREKFAELGEDASYQQTVVEMSLGTVYQMTGELERARGHYQAAGDGFAGMGYEVEAAAATLNLGEVEFLAANLDLAQEMYEEALKTLEVSNADDHKAFAYLSLARVAAARRSVDAESYYDKVGELYDDPGLAALAVLGRAELQLSRSNFGLAGARANEALKTFSKAGMSDEVVLAQAVLVRALLKLNKIDDAAKISETAMAGATLSERREVHWAVAMAAALVATAKQDSDLDAEIARLHRIVKDAEEKGFVSHAFQARLVLGEVMKENDPGAARQILQSLATKARERGFTQIAEHAENLL